MKTLKEVIQDCQLSFSEILIGHSSGLISIISFADEPASDKHTINEDQFFLSELTSFVLTLLSCVAFFHR